jgi:hypothetical protein
MVFFAEHVKGANIDKLRAEVQKSGSKRLINAFKEFVDGINIED